jgi:siroheme synthase
MSDNVPYAVSLVLHQDSEKPGWRIHISPESNENAKKEGYVVSIAQALALARVATEIIETVTQEDSTTPFMVVRNGTTAMRSALEQRLAHAEAEAANVAALRQKLTEFDS